MASPLKGFKLKPWMKISAVVVAILVLYANRPGRDSDEKSTSVQGAVVTPVTTIPKRPTTTIPAGPGAGNASGGVGGGGSGGISGNGSGSASGGIGGGSTGSGGNSSSRVIPPGNPPATNSGNGSAQIPGGTPVTTAVRSGPAIPFPDGRTPATTIIGTTIAPPEKATDPSCHPSYSGICLPFTSRVDCANKGGPGPIYANGPFNVVGPDVYGLDPDGNGVACDT